MDYRLLNLAEFREQISNLNTTNDSLEETDEIKPVHNPEDVIIYLVIESGGSYDGYYTAVRSIFNSKEKADEEIINLYNYYEELRNSKEPFVLNYNTATKEMIELYNNWESYKIDAEEYRRFDVETFILNKSDLNNWL